MEEGESARALTYLRELLEESESKGREYHTGNILLDYMLTEHHNWCNERGIQSLIVLNLPAPLQLDDYELTVLLGNLMDNVKNALSALDSADNAFSKLTIYQEEGKFQILFQNTCNPDAVGRPGWGIHNLTTVVDRYQGLYEAKVIGNTYQALVVL